MGNMSAILLEEHLLYLLQCAFDTTVVTSFSWSLRPAMINGLNLNIGLEIAKRLQMWAQKYIFDGFSHVLLRFLTQLDVNPSFGNQPSSCCIPSNWDEVCQIPRPLRQRRQHLWALGPPVWCNGVVKHGWLGNPRTKMEVLMDRPKWFIWLPEGTYHPFVVRSSKPLSFTLGYASESQFQMVKYQELSIAIPFLGRQTDYRRRKMWLLQIVCARLRGWSAELGDFVRCGIHNNDPFPIKIHDWLHFIYICIYYYIILYCIVLYYIILYCIVLYYIILDYIRLY